MSPGCSGHRGVRRSVAYRQSDRGIAKRSNQVGPDWHFQLPRRRNRQSLDLRFRKCRPGGTVALKTQGAETTTINERSSLSSRGHKTLFNGFRVFTLALVLWGSLQDLGTAFGFADVTMGLLAVVNLAAVVLLMRVGLRIMRDYDEQRRAGIEHPVFAPDKFPDLNSDRKAWALDQGVVAPAQARPAVS